MKECAQPNTGHTLYMEDTDISPLAVDALYWYVLHCVLESAFAETDRDLALVPAGVVQDYNADLEQSERYDLSEIKALQKQRFLSYGFTESELGVIVQLFFDERKDSPEFCTQDTARTLLQSFIPIARKACA